MVFPDHLYFVNLPLFFVLHQGDVPVEDPHHGPVLCLHAGEEVGPPPVVLAAPTHGWHCSSAGTIRHWKTWSPWAANKHTGVCIHSSDVLATLLSRQIQSPCTLVLTWCFNHHSGPQSLEVTRRRRSWRQDPSLWDWWPCWWPVCPVALLEFTLKKSSRRLNRVCGSETYSWVSDGYLDFFGDWYGAFEENHVGGQKHKLFVEQLLFSLCVCCSIFPSYFSASLHFPQPAPSPSLIPSFLFVFNIYSFLSFLYSLVTPPSLLPKCI